MTLKYVNGSSNLGCQLNGVAIPRELWVTFACDPDSEGSFDNALVAEFEQCKYLLNVTSLYGCPLECRVPGASGAGSVCGGNGACGFDTDAGFSRCFCYDGFAGTYCQEAADSGASAQAVETAFLVIVCLMLAAVIGLTVYMVRRLQKLQVDPQAYSDLQGRFNELGMIA